jgi:hypothetical protein
MYVDVCEPTYLSPDGSRSPIDVRGNPEEAGSIFRLLKQRVVRASSDNGVLSLVFADGSELRDPPDERYETWGVIGAGRVYQCLAGGEVDWW